MFLTDDNHDPHEESQASNVVATPGGTMYWIPVVPDALKPIIHSVFDSLEAGIKMYANYAEYAGFDVRRGTQSKKRNGMVKLKYILCSRAGNGVRHYVNSLDSNGQLKDCRNSSLKVTDCPARVKFSLCPGDKQYELYFFEEKHNHMFIEAENRDLLRKRRQLDLSDYRFIHRASASNIGPTKAHKLRSLLKGGYGCTGGTVIDHKNFRRDFYGQVGIKDGQYIIDKLKNRKACVPSFSFEYEQEGRMLTRLFWTDEVCKLNYREFGDVISFDATFRTNK